jgi:DNA-binding response OmpR family regulator
MGETMKTALIEKTRKVVPVEETTKVLLYGHDSVTRKIQEALLAKRAEVFSIPGGLENVTALGEADEMSLAIVDITTNEADEVYEYLKSHLNIPVVLVVSNWDDDWRKLAALDADGFLFRKAGQSEIVARLEAIQRRIKKAEANVVGTKGWY